MESCLHKLISSPLSENLQIRSKLTVLNGINFPTTKYYNPQKSAFSPLHTNSPKGRNKSTYLLIKPFHPPPQILPLLPRQILTRIQRPIQILGQHLLIKALTRQSPRGIPPREVLIHPARTVEISSGGHVVDFSLHSEIHGPVVGAVVGQQGSGREGAENGGGGALGEFGGGSGAEAEVEDGEEEDEEGQVERGGEGVEDFAGDLLVGGNV